MGDRLHSGPGERSCVIPTYICQVGFHAFLVLTGVSHLLCGEAYERMIHARRTWFPESRRLIPNVMFGFQIKLCATDCILDPASDIDHYSGFKTNTAAVFLDIKKAYDNVSFVVVRRLQELGVAGRAEVFITDFIYNRSLQVRLGRVLSESRILGKGLPQGSVLSPILFIVVLPSTLSFPVDFPPEVNLTLFSGDICIWASARFNKPLASRVEADLDHIT